jgi:hypothetical protein
MAQHGSYWTCSPFADWIRGTTKLKMGTSEEWHDWEVRAKADYPVRWWIAEEGLGHLQDFVTWPVRKIYDLKYYINNRWVSHTHALTAHPRDIKPGEWRDVGNRFLPCLFNELVDFVEVEQAWHHIAWNDDAKEKFKAPFWASGWFRWRTWRCPEAGIASLDWAINLVWDKDWGMDETSPDFGKPTQQAIRAKEIKELYIWWTTVYPARPDPHDASGWSEYCDRLREERGGDHWIGMSSKSPETEKMGKKALKLSQKIEEAYDKEDEAMMIRLIKIRDSLWT